MPPAIISASFLSPSSKPLQILKSSLVNLSMCLLSLHWRSVLCFPFVFLDFASNTSLLLINSYYKYEEKCLHSSFAMPKSLVVVSPSLLFKNLTQSFVFLSPGHLWKFCSFFFNIRAQEFVIFWSISFSSFSSWLLAGILGVVGTFLIVLSLLRSLMQISSVLNTLLFWRRRLLMFQLKFFK